jgi:uncharacterized protein (DUF2147 family)
VRSTTLTTLALAMAAATAAHAQPSPDAGEPVPPPPAIASLAPPPGVPAGVWLLPLNAAVQVYACEGLLCGRIVWMQRSRNEDGVPVRDGKNPDPALRPRPLCGLTLLWGLKPVAPDHWANGWLYNPHDGATYRINGAFRDADTLVVRIYRGIPLFGQTSVWRRVPRLSSEGWC